MSGLKHLSNDLLIDSYFQAVKMDLESDFIGLLLDEIRSRGIESRINLNLVP
ncbi:Sporulation inhibitor A [Gracilibacillus orientalis]|uniref:Sporulation inhibitor A n=1 Tax=Gracilibacillus orientalis TaxID=334253 RepID=A0A1I4H8N9_9BACI|nr:sporulation histidine kinase inhibitor Sda [Gracilibacillus orientalis]SFL38672.1 Sporulation inhibitor A [Gracilibacillus orientalis]